MLAPYRSIDLYDGKYGVNPVINGFLLRFKPWYFDGKTVWWGDQCELRSEAENAALILKELVEKLKI
tara:strand:- start:320 stop:520 length:201 start_codon:yes stop_codon:yes gene_type:complete